VRACYIIVERGVTGEDGKNSKVVVRSVILIACTLLRPTVVATRTCCKWWCATAVVGGGRISQESSCNNSGITSYIYVSVYCIYVCVYAFIQGRLFFK